MALASRSVQEMLGAYVRLSVPEMQRLVALARRHVLAKPLHGVGIELGAGCGLLASVVAQESSVRTVLALEICDQAARLIIPKVAARVLGVHASKVVPVVGSFDDLHLPDESLDFVVEIDSLHHADNLTGTLRECARVLKPRGRVLCFDRCHPDTMTDRQVDEKLSVTYSPEFLMANHYPADAVLTRRENGEHEYRLFEWKAAFAGAGLRLTAMGSFFRFTTSYRTALDGLLTLFPRSFRRGLQATDSATPRDTVWWFLERVRTVADYCRRQGRFLAPKQTTVFALEKP